jgi:MFS family permease
MEALSKRDLHNSIRDGVFANMFAALTGGVFLTGFALHLGMNEFMIGLLGAMPFLVTVFQLPAAYFIQRKGSRKRFALWAAAVARGLWIPIMLVAMLPILSASLKSAMILGVILLSYASASVSFVSWLSWTSDLVPESMRGRFFGTRNMINGAAGILAVFIFGHLLDHLNHHRDGGQAVGFALTFGAAVLFGVLSLSFLNRISEPELALGDGSHAPFSEHFVIAFKSDSFRRFLWFTFAWSFSVYFASPFFSLYFLRDLRFSYGFVATLAMISAFADLLGMRLWGKISDKVRNKAIIRLASWIAAFLPLVWVTVSPVSKVVPIVLHLVGGGFWAGINLCMNNLLLRISPRENRPAFLSVYHIVGGLGAAAGPLLAGWLVRCCLEQEIELLTWTFRPLQVIFLLSTAMRVLSLHFLKYVREPEEMTVSQMVRVLRSIRGLNMATGFNYLLHPFIEVSGIRRESQESGPGVGMKL